MREASCRNQQRPAGAASIAGPPASARVHAGDLAGTSGAGELGLAGEPSDSVRILPRLGLPAGDWGFMSDGAGKVDDTSNVFATVHLDLESRPECITLVRSMLAGLGEHLQLDPELTDDLKTAVSEACNNVVLHAYDGRAGPLELSVDIFPDELAVSVRDRGSGIRRAAVGDDSRMGVGLAVISALAHRAEFESSAGEGTEVKMSFTGAGLPSGFRPVAAASILPELSGDILASVAPSEMLHHVLGRLVRAVAAGSHFAVDRFAGLSQLTGAIGTLVAARADGGPIGFAIAGHPRRIDLEVGLLPTGSVSHLFDGAATPDSIEPLLKELETVSAGRGELLRAVIVEPRR